MLLLLRKCRAECCFKESFAHVFENGKIKRYGSVIGSVADLEITSVGE